MRRDTQINLNAMAPPIVGGESHESRELKQKDRANNQIAPARLSKAAPRLRVQLTLVLVIVAYLVSSQTLPQARGFAVSTASAEAAPRPFLDADPVNGSVSAVDAIGLTV